MSSYRGSWLKKCVECGVKFKPRAPHLHEIKKLEFQENGERVHRCGLLVCNGTQEDKDNYTIRRVERVFEKGLSS